MKTEIIGNESELNSLFKETLDGVRDDLNEASRNVELYFEAILNETGGKEMYGTFYNDSLKIKGAARDRQLKFLNMFKDRVAKKESLSMAIAGNKDGNNENFISQKEMNDAIQELKKEKITLNRPQISINPIVNREDEDDYDDELEIDFEDEENE